MRGLDHINQTFQINYDVFQLINYSNLDSYPYEVTYSYNGSLTNHTNLIDDLIGTELYDLVVLVGYELRRGYLDFSDYTDTDFLYYDLSGEFPEQLKNDIPDNVHVVGFQENHLGFIAGSLAVAEFHPLPKKIGIVGTYRGDPRSRLQIAGFQSAIFRNTTNVDILIGYVDDWINAENSQNLGNEYSDQDFELVFAALQAANSFEFLRTFSGGEVITVDLNQTMSVKKNNTQVLIDVFQRFNESQGFFGGVSALYGIADNVFYAEGWTDASLVNKTMVELYDEVVSEELFIPTDVKYASNTPSFNFIMVLISLIIIYPFLRKLKYHN
jgi:basic membrane lipoprotein Med (substrate-binding protein (PBP1-ABC) superfamily)